MPNSKKSSKRHTKRTPMLLPYGLMMIGLAPNMFASVTVRTVLLIQAICKSVSQWTLKKIRMKTTAFKFKLIKRERMSRKSPISQVLQEIGLSILVICKSINIKTNSLGKKVEFLTQKHKKLKMFTKLFMIILILTKSQKMFMMVTKIPKPKEVTSKALGKSKKKKQ